MRSTRGVAPQKMSERVGRGLLRAVIQHFQGRFERVIGNEQPHACVPPSMATPRLLRRGLVLDEALDVGGTGLIGQMV